MAGSLPPCYFLMREIQDSCCYYKWLWHFPNPSFHNFIPFVLVPGSHSDIVFIWCLGGFFFRCQLFMDKCLLIQFSSIVWKHFFFFFLLVWFCVFYAQWLLWDGVDEPTYRFRLVLCGWFRMFVTFMVCRSWRGGLFYTLLARIGMSCVCQTVLSYAPLEFYHNFFFGEWFSTLKKKICKLL